MFGLLKNLRKRKVFSVRVLSDKRFGRSDRDYLMEFILSEIENGVDVIVDEVFEERNCEEYILSSDAAPVQEMMGSISRSLGYRVLCKEVV